MDFEVLDKHQKQYPHFDAPLSKIELQNIANSPKRVAENAFFPLIQYDKSYQPFRDKLKKPDKKRRPIRYASRRDSIIFSKYRSLLSDRYEDELFKRNISNVPIAYRKIPLDSNSNGGKCNIHFAKDLFDEIKCKDKCTVFALDISQFFESIDHQRLYQVWCDLLGVQNLPDDHLSVFEAVTQYAYVYRTEVYRRLGFISEHTLQNGKTVSKYDRKYIDMPKQLCTPSEFRKKIAGGKPELCSLIKKNSNSYGIPQGVPMSDLLANAYLLDFDDELSKFVKARNGKYWRYSDDIAIVLEGDSKANSDVTKYVSELIKNYGTQLKLKEEKSLIVEFDLTSGVNHEKGIEYLGFRFDGKNVYIRNCTLSNFYRKLKKSIKWQARNHVARYAGKDLEWLLKNFNYNKFEKKFGRVENFERYVGVRNWTFWTYVKRATACFGDQGKPIINQVGNYRKFYRRELEAEIRKQLSKNIS